MSRSRPITYPSEYVPEEARHYIGKDKPKVQVTRVPADKQWYYRNQAALRLHKDQSELEDEPDFDTHLEMDRDPIHEGEN